MSIRWILDLDILLLVSGIARKHGIMPKPFLGRPQYFLPPKNPFSSKNKRFLEKESLWLLKSAITRKCFKSCKPIWGGQSSCSPHLTPQIQCLPGGACGAYEKSTCMLRYMVDMLVPNFVFCLFINGLYPFTNGHFNIPIYEWAVLSVLRL